MRSAVRRFSYLDVQIFRLALQAPIIKPLMIIKIVSFLISMKLIEQHHN